jgi:hypothetical protein
MEFLARIHYAFFIIFSLAIATTCIFYANMYWPEITADLTAAEAAQGESYSFLMVYYTLAFTVPWAFYTIAHGKLYKCFLEFEKNEQKFNNDDFYSSTQQKVKIKENEEWFNRVKANYKENFGFIWKISLTFIIGPVVLTALIYFSTFVYGFITFTSVNVIILVWSCVGVLAIVYSIIIALKVRNRKKEAMLHKLKNV